MDVADYLASAGNDPALSELVRSYLERASLHAGAALASVQRHDWVNGRPVPALFYRAVRDTAAEGAATEHERERRQEARLRILAYHWHHAVRLVTPEPDIDRYEASALFRWRVDVWYFFMAPARAAIPPEWVARSPVLRSLRRVLVRLARLLMRR